MSAASPMALRARFQEYGEERLCGSAAAARLKPSAATGVRWLRKIREHGNLELAAQGRPRGHGKLVPRRAFLEELVEHDDDIRLRNWPGRWKRRLRSSRILHPSGGF